MKIQLEAAGHQRDPHAYICQRPAPSEAILLSSTPKFSLLVNNRFCRYRERPLISETEPVLLASFHESHRDVSISAIRAK